MTERGVGAMSSGGPRRPTTMIDLTVPATRLADVVGRVTDDQLADPTLYEKDPKAATQLSKERADLTHALAGHEDTWLTLSSEYEEATAD